MAFPCIVAFAFVRFLLLHVLVHTCSAQTCLSAPTIQLGFGNCTFSDNGSYIESYGILFGASDSENLCLMPSTVVNSTMLMSSEVCDPSNLDGLTPSQCLSLRGGVITRSALPSAPTDTLASLNLGWVSLTSIDTSVPWQYAAQTALQFRDQAVTMIEGLVTQGHQHAMSHLGLAESSTFLQSLKDAGMIAARSWGFNAGSQSYSAPRDGSLVLGGYDQSSVNGKFYDYNIAVPDVPLNNRPCPLKVTITSMSLILRNTSTAIISPANKLEACIEPYDSLFRLPLEYLNVITQEIAPLFPTAQVPVNASAYNNTLWDIEPGFVYPANSSLDISLELTLDGGLSVKIPTYELVRPLRGLDANGTQVVDLNYNEVQIYSQPAPEDGPVLPKVFLSQVYLYVNYETMKFSVAQQTLNPVTPLPKTSATCPAQGLSNSDKGLIAVGAVLGVLVLGLLAYLAYRYLNGKPNKANGDGAPLPEGNSTNGTDIEEIVPPSVTRPPGRR